ncbi:TPA: CDW92 antigen-like [Bos taurus]|nr:TPA: CDW92 antigen-like [Bos taurus]
MGGGNGSFAHHNCSLGMRNLHGEQNQPHKWAGFSLTLRSTGAGSALCSYDLKPSEYASSKAKGLCPKLPVPASAPIPFFHRCAPVNISCYAKFAEALITFVSDNSVLHRLISGVMTSKEIILGLCLLSLVLSMILMVIIRYISRILVWILTFLLILGSLAGTGVLWWLYAKQRKSPKETVIPDQPQVAEANLRALLIYAISATVFTVILFLVMLVMRKRVALTIALFHVAGKVFIHLPLLVFQPFWTFFALVLFWVYWIMTLLFLGTAGSAVQNEQGFVEFKMSGPLQYMWWYHVVGLIWISEFILACQQMTVPTPETWYNELLKASPWPEKMPGLEKGFLEPLTHLLPTTTTTTINNNTINMETIVNIY